MLIIVQITVVAVSRKDIVISDQQFRPLTPDVLAGDIAHAARRHPAERVRVVIDGALDDDTDALARRVLGVVADLGLTGVHVRAGDFLRARSIRLETGADDPDAGYWRWVDHDALLREVLTPFPQGRYLPSLRDPERDRPTRARPVEAPQAAVLVLSGPMLLRTELTPAVDVGVHLGTTAATLRRRLDEDDATRVVGAWELYQEWDRPTEAAALVVRHDHPDRPALQR